MSHITPQFTEEMKQVLLSEKARLEADLAGTPAHTDLGDDVDENADEIAINEVNTDLRARMEQDIAKIEKALAKIEAGTYGTDDEGKEIAEARLRAIPWADKAI
jgi:RNA polymerase-binding transcription factor DksA